MPEFKKHEPGTFCYAELVTNDPAASGNFYTELFGWSRNDQDMGEYGIYTQFQIDGKVVAAQYKLNAEQEAQDVPPHWGQYVSVDDADAATARAAELGGSVLMGPLDVMDYGRMSILADPAGATFCIWQPRANVGVGLRDEPGTMCWAELMTTDPDQAKDFYGGLFGWENEAMDMGEMGTYTMFNRPGAPAGAGMLPLGPDMGPMPPSWMIYFATDDLDKTHARAVELGAHQVVPPTDIPQAGRFAVLADPTGAVFAIWKSIRKD